MEDSENNVVRLFKQIKSELGPPGHISVQAEQTPRLR